MKRTKIHLGQDHTLPSGMVCPTCGLTHIGAFHLSEESAAAKPRPGCIVLCADCGNFSEITPEMTLRKIDSEALRNLSPEMQRFVKFYAAQLKLRRAVRGN